MGRNSRERAPGPIAALPLLLLLGCSPVNLDVPEDAIPSAGCGGADHEMGPFHETMVVGEEARSYVLRLPGTYDPDFPHPVITALHGSGGNGAEFREFAGLEAASRARAIYVYPDAVGDHSPSWRIDEPADPDGVFLRALQDHIEAKYCVDEARWFVVGHSNGGMMANHLGCTTGDRVRGVASFAGAGPFTECRGRVAAWIGHAEGDDVVDAENGRASRDYWLERNDCTLDTEAHPPAPCVRYVCHEDFPVVWCEYDAPESYSHWWPDWAGDSIWDLFGSM